VGSFLRRYWQPVSSAAKVDAAAAPSFEERQAAPGDFEAQSSQGSFGVPNHSTEHLVRSDTGIVLQRKLLKFKREITSVTKGEDPINTAFIEGAESYRRPLETSSPVRGMQSEHGKNRKDRSLTTRPGSLGQAGRVVGSPRHRCCTDEHANPTDPTSVRLH
jgi:hypothetical protein